jgi:diamine N-acetyltransferase
VPEVTISLREITEDNGGAVQALRTTPGQARYVSSVVNSLEEAAQVPQANPWFRAVYADERPVGFVMLAWNVDPQPPGIIGPWFLWKLLIDHRHQRRGYGQEVMRQIIALVRAQGATELLTSYSLVDGGPEGFYQSLGFLPTGSVHDGEVLASLRLDGYVPLLVP